MTMELKRLVLLILHYSQLHLVKCQIKVKDSGHCLLFDHSIPYAPRTVVGVL